MKRQALFLTLGNGFTRALGFALHLIFARLMGAEALGVMELAHSVGMLALTPVTARMPAAVSRLTARRKFSQGTILRAAQRLNLIVATVMIPLLMLLSPLMSWFLGDMRTLPAILMDIPCVLLLGQCSVYNGYCYGLQDTLTPALNECLEQSLRFVLSVILLLMLRARSVALCAALPEAAELLAAAAALVMFRRCIRPSPSAAVPSPALMKEIAHLSAPMVVSRLAMTLMRTMNAVLLPACLRRSGLSAGAATSQYGLFSGMAMPLMMLPGVVTGAVCMVAAPAVSRAEQQPRSLKRLIGQLGLSALIIGLCASAVLFVLSEFIGTHLYRQIALPPLVRVLCPLALIFSLNQVFSGIIAGLGLQRKSLTGTLAASSLTLIFTALLAPLASLRLFGAALATLLGNSLGLAWNAGILLGYFRRISRQ